jgi:EAL domain-containing protein (putative c-di-GMP-specific phosphodiesterase class I)
MIESMNIQPSDVILEITESIFALEIQEVRKILVKLQNSGLKIALDDFGTGYSSLARGRELNVDYLKIDKLFIDKLVLLKEDVTITDDVISMAHKLGYLAIAEGVEHQEQRQYLEKHGCDKIQGYLISKPLDEEDAISLIEEYENNGSQT